MGAIFSKVMTGNAPKRTRLREKICMDQDVVVHTRARGVEALARSARPPAAPSNLGLAPSARSTATSPPPLPPLPLPLPHCHRGAAARCRRWAGCRRRPGSPQQTSPAQQRSQPRTSTPPAVALSTMHRVRALSSHLAPSVAAAEETVSREMGKTCTPSGPWHPRCLCRSRSIDLRLPRWLCL
jgi:hypothetical protein